MSIQTYILRSTIKEDVVQFIYHADNFIVFGLYEKYPKHLLSGSSCIVLIYNTVQPPCIIVSKHCIIRSKLYVYQPLSTMMQGSGTM